MASRFLAFALVALLLAFALPAATVNIKSAFAQQDGLWYPGEGVKQDMFVHYQIQDYDTNNNRPFEMTIWFKEQDSDGNWLAPTFVRDQGEVISGQMKLTPNMESLSGTGADIPQEMRQYVSAYSRTLHWLDAFTTQSAPLSLTQPSWGKIASIGGSEVKPAGGETVTVPAGTFDTTLIMWHKGVDSKVWVLNEFPFPVKALTYADVTTGNQPIQYAFELLETGTGQPEMPTSVDNIPTPPLSGKTRLGTHSVEITWDPEEIQPNSTVVFGVTMTESNGFPLERVNYDFTVKDASGEVIQTFDNQNAELGTATHEVTFGEAGPATVTVTLNSISGTPAGGPTGTFTEQVDFNIVVVPEFPVGIALVAGAVIGLVVLMSRARGNPLTGLFGGKNTL